MNYKLEGAIRRNRGNFIIFALLWLLIAIVFVPPVSYAIFLASTSGVFEFALFVQEWTSRIFSFLPTLGLIFSEGAGVLYFKNVLIATLIYSVFFFIGMAKTAPKNRYTDMEHGSSDWSKKGEQYEILSKNKGIILAENNYLPVDKRGNVNILVVGRIRFTENQHHIQFQMHIRCLVHTYLQILRENYTIEQRVS